MIISKRPETNSLFVEDRMTFAVTKIAIGAVVILVGIGGLWKTLDSIIALVKR